MNKIEELLEKDNGLYTSYSVTDKEGIYKKLVSSEKAVEITKDIAIKFAEWRNGKMYNKEKGIDGKQIIRENYPNYYELLFEEFLKTL